ncbi:MAG: hypothetical protein J2P36_31735 [Ktedonobacteraceae bacterium]|nr:hypothetical protein [Ktedonobacteraceae bacterium]
MTDAPASYPGRQRRWRGYHYAVRRSGRKTLGIPPETVLAHLRFAPSGGKEAPAAAGGKMQEG